MTAIDVAEREPVPGRRAVRRARRGDVGPCGASARISVFSIALIGALTLSTIRARGRDRQRRAAAIPQLRFIRAGGASYRTPKAIRFVAAEATPTVGRLSRIGAAAALVVALGVVQIALLARALG